MKTLFALITALLLTVTARAQLIDLTPGGFNISDGIPPAYDELQNQIFFDEAAHGFFDLPGGRTYLDEWVSMFGDLDGGTYFFTDLFGRDTAGASIWWDFDHTNFGLTMIDVWGRKPDGTAWEHIYGVKRSKQRKSPPVLVTLDGMTFIQSIAFYGTDTLRARLQPRRAILMRDIERKYDNKRAYLP